MCLSQSICNHCCSRLQMCCPQLGPTRWLISIFPGSSPCWLTGPEERAGPHSSVPDSGPERGPRPMSYLRWESPAPLSPPPQAWGWSPHPRFCSSWGRRLLPFPMSLPGIALPGCGSTQDPGMGGGRAPGQEACCSCPNPGWEHPPNPDCKNRPDGRPRPLSSSLPAALRLCLKGTGR